MTLWTTRAHDLLQAQATILANALTELTDDDPRTLKDARHIGFRSAAGHERRLRGIPVQGVRGITGTIAGTNPVAVLMAKQPRDDA